MQPYQERVVQEKKDLDEKIRALEGFCDGDIYVNLPDDEQSRLVVQLELMMKYSKVLGERIANFK